MPRSAARAAIASILQAPSSSEYSLCTWRWATLTERSSQARQMPPAPDSASCEDHDAVIWLLRHGDASDDAADDASRALTDMGERQAAAAGAALGALDAGIEACLTSPKI